MTEAEEQALRDQMRTRVLAALDGSRDVFQHASYPAALAILGAAACAPIAAAALGAGAVATATVSVVATLGTPTLERLVDKVLRRMKQHGNTSDVGNIESELLRTFEDTLTDSSEEARRAASEVARLLGNLDTAQAALLAVSQSGNENLERLIVDLAETLQSGLRELGGHVEASFSASELRDNQVVAILSELRQTQLHQGARAEFEQRQNRELRERLAVVLDGRNAGVPKRDGRTGASSEVDGDPQQLWLDEPYLGLTPFGEDQADVYFGRESLVARLIDRTALAARASRPLVVTGASGTGKSSVLHAGLIPAIRRGKLAIDGSARWPCVVVTPGADPLERLHDACAAHADRAGLVLVLDQFEETFTLVSDPSVRSTLVDELMALAQEDDAVVILGLRGDFIDDCATLPQLQESIDAPCRVPAMTAPEARRAITGPAAAAGLEMDDDLPDTILADLTSNSGVDPTLLPLLSQTMRLLWERRSNGRLRTSDYLAFELAEAIRISADEVYESLSPGRKKLAESIFRLLVVPGRSGMVRREADPAEVEDLGPDASGVLDCFVAKRLIVMHEKHVEAAHDSLLTNWPRLRSWLRSDVDSLLLRHQVIDAADEWIANRRDQSYLIGGTRLQSVIAEQEGRWADHPDRFAPLTVAATEFLTASRHRDRLGRRRARAVVSAIAVLALVASLAATGAWRLNASLTAQRDALLTERLVKASDELRGTEGDRSRLLAAAAWELTGPNGPRANQAWRAMAASAADPSMRLLADAESTANLAVKFSDDGSELATEDHNGTLTVWAAGRWRPTHLRSSTDQKESQASLSFSPNGRMLAVAEPGANVEIWDIRSRRIVMTLPRTGHVNTTDFAPDGTAIVTADYERPPNSPSGHSQVRTWSLTDARRPLSSVTLPLIGNNENSGFAAKYRTLSRIAIADPGGRVQIWDPSRHALSRGDDLAPDNDNSSVVDFWSHNDTSIVCMASYGCAIRGPHQNYAVGGGSGPGLGGAISPDGSRVVVRSSRTFDGYAIWNTVTRRSEGTFRCGICGSGSTGDVQFSFRTGSSQLVGGSPTGALLLDPERADTPTRVLVPAHRKMPVGLSTEPGQATSPGGVVVPRGSTTAYGLLENSLWRLRTGPKASAEPMWTTPKSKIVSDLAGTTVVVMRTNSHHDPTGIELRDLRTGSLRRIIPLPRQLTGKPLDSWTLETLSADGTHLAYGAGRDVWVTDIASGSTAKLALGRSAVDSFALNRDGSRIVSLGASGELQSWDAGTGSLIRTVGHLDNANSVSFAGTADTVITTSDEDVRSYAIDLWGPRPRQHLHLAYKSSTDYADSLGASLSNDRQYIVEAGFDETRVWNVSRRVEVGSIPSSNIAYNIATFSADGKSILSFDPDRGFISVDIQRMLSPYTAVCRSTPRALSQSERHKYLPGISVNDVRPCADR